MMVVTDLMTCKYHKKILYNKIKHLFFFVAISGLQSFFQKCSTNCKLIPLNIAISVLYLKYLKTEFIALMIKLYFQHHYLLIFRNHNNMLVYCSVINNDRCSVRASCSHLASFLTRKS